MYLQLPWKFSVGLTLFESFPQFVLHLQDLEVSVPITFASAKLVGRLVVFGVPATVGRARVEPSRGCGMAAAHILDGLTWINEARAHRSEITISDKSGETRETRH